VNYYPVFLNLNGKKAVVVGGGKVSQRKVISLLDAGADVTVISPSLTSELRKALFRGRIRHIPRLYRKNDLKGAFLVVAATDSAETNRKVSKDAPALVNVVDVPEECNFIAPSVVRRGQLLIAISTGGASPAFSRALRKDLQVRYGPEFSGYLKFVKEIRAKAMATIPQGRGRELFLKGLASEEILSMIRTKGVEAVKKTVNDRLKKMLPAYSSKTGA
jgi:precorrin-2 dehydrogenase/sirohydrochlorin ferrochelatase